MTDRQHRMSVVFMYGPAALGVLKLPFRALGVFHLNPFLIASALLEVLFAVLLVMGARVAWARGAKVTVPDLE